MFRALFCVLLVACSSPKQPAPTTPVVTTPPEPAKPPEPPKLDAQATFTLWLEAFNAADYAGIATFMKRLAPAIAKDFPPPEQQRGFREQTGGFDIKKTESVTPTKFAAILKEKASDQYARVELELDATNAVSKLDLNAIPTPDEFKPPRLSEADAIAALKAELDKLAAEDKFSGAVLVAKNGKPIFAQAYGMADRENKIANTVDTRFRIGSMNKMFTATATLQLVQAKKLALEDTVGKVLPDYPNKQVADKVTIAHLLTHHGGTGDIFGPDYDKKRLELRTLQDYVKLYGNRDPLHAPGEKMQYSNYGFLLLGVIVEKITKKTYYDYVETKIFKPAKMTSTSSPFEDKPMKGRAIAYTKDLGDKQLDAWTDAKDTLPIRATSAGGGDSTVNDLLRFANALTASKLLDAKHTELLTTHKVGKPGMGYAYGFGVNTDGEVKCFGHGGGANGMNGELSICSNGYTFAILANLDPPAAGRVLKFIKARLPVK